MVEVSDEIGARPRAQNQIANEKSDRPTGKGTSSTSAARPDLNRVQDTE